MIRKIKKQLRENKKFEIENFGIFYLLPRKKGKTFCGFSNKEGKPIYKNRVRFIPHKKLKDELCK